MVNIPTSEILYTFEYLVISRVHGAQISRPSLFIRARLMPFWPACIMNDIDHIIKRKSHLQAVLVEMEIYILPRAAARIKHQSVVST